MESEELIKAGGEHNAGKEKPFRSAFFAARAKRIELEVRKRQLKKKQELAMMMEQCELDIELYIAAAQEETLSELYGVALSISISDRGVFEPAVFVPDKPGSRDLHRGGAQSMVSESECLVPSCV